MARRFELGDGGSSKFWEVALEGPAVTVTFGRFGTKGQVQTKTFADEAKAQKEHDKLVAEKTKKGYVEVSGDAPEGPVVLGERARAEVLERRRGGVPAGPPLRFDEAAFFAGVTAWQESSTAAVNPGLTGADPRLRALSEAVVASFPVISWTIPSELDVDVEAARVVLCHFFYAWKARDVLVPMWVHVAGPAVALEILTRSASLAVGNEYARRRLIPAEPGGEGTMPFFFASLRHKEQHTWFTLRRHVARAPAAQHAEARAAAERHMQTASLEARARISFVFPDEPWAASVALEALGHAGARHNWLVCMLSCDLPRGTVERILEVAKPEEVAPFAYDVVDALGDADLLVPHLAKHKSFYGTKEGLVALRHVVGAIGAVKTAKSAELLVSYLDHKDQKLRAIASSALEEAPALALSVLPRAASGTTKLAEPARQLLGAIAASNPALVEPAQRALSATEGRVLASLLEQRGGGAEAAPEDVPQLLATPPWAKKRAKAAARVVAISLGSPSEGPPRGNSSLAPCVRTTRMHDGRNVVTYWGATGKQCSPELEADFIAKTRAIQAGGDPKVHTIGGCLPRPLTLFELSDEGRLSVWNGGAYKTFPDWAYQLFAIGRLMLERHGDAAIPGALDLVPHAKSDTWGAFEFLTRLVAPEVAPYMAAALARRRADRRDARAWLLACPEAAAVGLVPPAVGPAGRERVEAEAALRVLAEAGHREVVLDVAGRYGPDARAAIALALDCDPLQILPASIPKMPPFWDAASLPRPRLAGTASPALPLAAVDALGTMLRMSDFSTAYAGIERVRGALDAASLGEFAWGVFSAWMLAGAPPAHLWAFAALAHLGDDGVARKLAAKVRDWRSTKDRPKAEMALDALSAIGTDVALLQLARVAEKSTQPELRKAAQAKLAEAAAARGLTAEEMEDRIVPDLGLDARGTTVLDYGARRFTVGFDEHLRPFVRADDGKPIAQIPRAAASDDTDKAKEAIASWKALKADVETLADSQLARLERAMTSRRTWDISTFQTLLASHPLLQHVVRRLVWGVVDGPTFRVTEDGTYADAEDTPFEAPADTRVVLVHPIDLPAPALAAWTTVFGDYGLLQPFEQLGRFVYRPSPEEQAATSLAARVQGIQAPGGVLIGTLEKRGWRKGSVEEGIFLSDFEKRIGSRTLSLGVSPGIDFDALKAKTGQRHTIDVRLHGGGTFGELDALAFSELARDIEALRL